MKLPDQDSSEIEEDDRITTGIVTKPRGARERPIGESEVATWTHVAGFVLLRRSDRSRRRRPSSPFGNIWSRPQPRPSGACRSAPSRSPAAASISVSGRRAAARSSVEIEGLEPAALQCRGRRLFLAVEPAGASRHALSFPSRSRRRGAARPGLEISTGRAARAFGNRRSRGLRLDRRRRGAGVAREQLVIYEMHVGTFTPEGSWEAASRELPALAELGITCIEMMPVAEFPGPVRLGL